MQNLSRIYQLLDRAGCPSCTKALITAVFQATRRGSRFKMSRQAFRHGTDARYAQEQELLSQNEDESLVFTEKALGLIQ